MLNWGQLAFALAGFSALVWAMQFLRQRSYWELIAWLPGLALMLTGAFAVGLYQGNVNIIDEVGELLEIRRTLTIEKSSGKIRAVDGDTLQINDVNFRLEDIDSFEQRQCCINEFNKNIDCGGIARTTLKTLIESRTVTCTWLRTDTFGRPLATCSADGVNLNAAMVAAGQAIVFHDKDRRKGRQGKWRTKPTYLAEQKLAASKKFGMHAYIKYDPPHYARLKKKSVSCQ